MYAEGGTFSSEKIDLIRLCFLDMYFFSIAVTAKVKKIFRLKNEIKIKKAWGCLSEKNLKSGNKCLNDPLKPD